MQKHIYYCDICGKEIDKDEMQVIAPTVGYITRTIEACHNCIKEINKAIDAKIAELSHGIVIVERPYK